MLQVIDTNDNPPALGVNTLSAVDGVADVSEDTPPGAFVAIVTVTDADSGSNGRFTCSLDDPHFRLTLAGENEFQVCFGLFYILCQLDCF